MAVKLLRGWGAPHADSGRPTGLGADLGVTMVAEPPLWEAVALPWWSGCLASPLNAPRPSGYPAPGSPQTGLYCPCSVPAGTPARASPSRAQPDRPRVGRAQQHPPPLTGQGARVKVKVKIAQSCPTLCDPIQ